MLFALFRKPLWGAGSNRGPNSRTEDGGDEGLLDEESMEQGSRPDVDEEISSAQSNSARQTGSEASRENRQAFNSATEDDAVEAAPREDSSEEVDESVDENLDEVEESGGAESGTGFQDDPLASSAFDLERGEPIRKTHQGRRGGLPHRNLVDSAKEFFGQEILYRFDVLDDEKRNQTQGTYRLELKGYKGGVWTITVGDDLGVVNRREDAEIVLVLQQTDFVHIVNGELNPQLAILSQKMMVEGDMRKAIAFQNLLCPELE